jgi:hypothetical protein
MPALPFPRALPQGHEVADRSGHVSRLVESKIAKLALVVSYDHYPTRFDPKSASRFWKPQITLTRSCRSPKI